MKFPINNNRRIVIAVSLAACIFGFIFSIIINKNRKKAEVIKDEVYLRAFRKKADGWIRSFGGKKAYDLVKKEFENNQADSHSELHIFGETLYKIEGIDGFTVCDRDFGFGCYHGFMSRAIAEKGVEVAQALDKECLKYHGPYGFGCFHGIGHGLGEYFGPKRLREQLEICRSLTGKSLYLGCQDGVIMEYHFPTENTPVGTRQKLRDVLVQNPYDPCPGIGVPFKRVCHYRLPSWWYESFKDFDKIGTLCGEINDDVSRQSCFIGMGNAFHPQYKINVQEIHTLCRTAMNYKDGAYCYAGSRWVLFMLNRNEEAQALCDTLHDEDKEICMTKWNLADGSEK